MRRLRKEPLLFAQTISVSCIKYIDMSASETSLNENLKDVTITHEEKKRIQRNLGMSDKEKFLSFSKMLRKEIMLRQAKITHK